jgi:hypothetical protein
LFCCFSGGFCTETVNKKEKKTVATKQKSALMSTNIVLNDVSRTLDDLW